MSTRLETALSQSPVTEFVGRWHQGERESAREFLAQRPELGHQKSVILNLALEEFCLRRDSGETILPSTFCDQFPRYRKSLQRMLYVRGYIDNGGYVVQPLADVDFYWPEVGDNFLGFELLAVLGKGAFGQVFLARQDELGGRLVALKVAFYGGGEAKTLGRLPHPNIVPVFSISTDVTGQLTAVCMPFLGRATLCDLLDVVYTGEGWPDSAAVISRVANEQFEAGENDTTTTAALAKPDQRGYVEGIVDLFRQLAEALAFIHGEGYLHRDLKPSNVLLARGGVPMLLDFNLSIGIDRESEAVCGTLTYLPPELLRKLAADHRAPADAGDRRTDIFSLGVMFYELLTGSLPFGNPESNVPNDEAVRQLLSRQALGTPAPSIRNSQVSQELDGIIARCLALDPADRYADGAELLADLTRHAAPHTQTGQARRRRALLWGAGLLVAVASLGGAYLAVRGGAPFSNVGAGERRAVFAAPAEIENLVPEVTSLEQGLGEYEREEWQAAIAIFDRCLDEKPHHAETLFALGQAYRQLNDLDTAERYYERAGQHSQAGVIQACLGYCAAKKALYGQAVVLFEAALREDKANAGYLNNIAFAQIQLGKFEDAQTNLDLAVLLDENLYAARHNRAILATRLAFRTRQPPSHQAQEDVEIAVEIGPATAKLYADGAALYAAAARFGSIPIARAEELFCKALECGLEAQSAEAHPAYSEVKDSPGVRELLAHSASGASVAPELLVPPSLHVRQESF